MQSTVAAMYAALFNRAPEKAGLDFWCGQLDSGVSLAAMAQTMYNTEPARATYPDGISNADVVKAFYVNVLGRPGVAEGLAFWEGRLATLGTKGALIAEMVANVQSYTGTDADGVTSKALFDNKVSVGVNYAVTLGKEDVELAKKVMALVTATDTTAANDLATNKGQSFTLTTGADGFAGTTGNDTITGSVVNSLTANDVITDETTTDNDTLNVTLNTPDVKATIKNIENVNVTWTSNAGIAIDASNMKGNTFNLNATGLAFTGTAVVKAVGTNNVNAGSKVATSLTLNDVLDSKINAGAAKQVTIDATATVPTVGQKTTAAITVNGDTTVSNTAAKIVQNLTISASTAATVTLNDGGATLSGIGEKLTVAGSKDVTVKGIVTNEEIVKSMTDGAKLTVASTDAGALVLSKIDADLISIAGAATTVEVKDGQKLAVGTAAAGQSLTHLNAKTGLTNVTTNLTTAVDLKSLNVTGITNLNLEVTKNAEVKSLVTNDGNNVVITGAGDLTLTSSGVAAIDASALTGKFTYTSDAAATTGVIGSATAVNTLNLVSKDAGQTVTAITGAAADKINVTAASEGTLAIKAGAGNDVITVAGAVTGTAAIDGGEGTDTLAITTAAGITAANGTSKVSLSGIENIVAVTNTNFNNVQLSGQTYGIASTADDGVLNVTVFDKTQVATAATTDLSGLVLSTTTGANIKTVNVTGFDGIDTIKGTKAADVVFAKKGADVIDISQGGTDTIKIAVGDSTWAANDNKIDKITGFNAVATATAVDKLEFAKFVKADTVDVGVAKSITGNVGTEAVTANVSANGLLTLSGVDSTKIDTLVEWVSVATAALNGGAAKAVEGETLAFAFGGDTYVMNVATVTSDAVATFDMVQLVGVTGVAGVGAAAANTIFVAATVVV